MSRQANRGTESKKMVTGACDLGGWGGMEVFCGKGPSAGCKSQLERRLLPALEGVVHGGKKGAHWWVESGD